MNVRKAVPCATSSRVARLAPEYGGDGGKTAGDGAQKLSAGALYITDDKGGRVWRVS